MITLVVNDPWWTYGLDFLIAFLAGIAADRLAIRWAREERPEDEPGLH